MRMIRMPGRRRDERGSAAMELLVMMPLYVILFLLIDMLANLAWLQEKTDIAARYTAWDRTGSSDAGPIFADVSHRPMSYSAPPPSGEPTAMRSLYVDTGPGPNPGRISANLRDIGSGANGSALVAVAILGGQSHPGGWVYEYQSTATGNYSPGGLIGGSWDTYCEAYAIMGKTFNCYCLPGGGGFKYRDSKVDWGAGQMNIVESGLWGTFWPQKQFRP